MKKGATVLRHKRPDKHDLFPKISLRARKAFYLEISKYLSDISKLIFGGIILTNVLNFNISKTIIFTAGSITVIILTRFSFVLFLKGKE